VATGALRNAIASDSRGTSGRVGLKPDGIGSGAGPTTYWRFVEFGTVHQPARPFFRPAVDEEEQHFIARMRAIGPKVERDLSTGRFE
jgi:HK97 gp10 family phage protein